MLNIKKDCTKLFISDCVLTAKMPIFMPVSIRPTNRVNCYGSMVEAWAKKQLLHQSTYLSKYAVEIKARCPNKENKKAPQLYYFWL